MTSTSQQETKLALLKLPEANTPTQGVFKNLHGYWQPPEFVIEFWATGSSFRFTNEIDYQQKAEEIQHSYLSAVEDERRGEYDHTAKRKSR